MSIFTPYVLYFGNFQVTRSCQMNIAFYGGKNISN